jgi:hypothetical protein
MPHADLLLQDVELFFALRANLVALTSEGSSPLLASSRVRSRGFLDIFFIFVVFFRFILIIILVFVIVFQVDRTLWSTTGNLVGVYSLDEQLVACELEGLGGFAAYIMQHCPQTRDGGTVDCVD